VLWFEFGGGWVFDYNEDDLTNSNVKVRIVDNESAAEAAMTMALRIVGFGATPDTYIAIHRLDLMNPDSGAWADWKAPGNPINLGILDPGRNFTVHLDDPLYPGIDDTYTQNLFVTGTNPNTAP
jgi:hypothetical protein